MSQINISNLTFAYDGSFDNVFENVSFSIDTAWRLGLTGRNGRGKTTLLRLLLGKLEYSGSIASSVAFEYFPFDIADISKTAVDIFEQLFPNYEYWKLSRELNLLEVDEALLYQPFENLSQGERTKIMLAMLFSKDNSFLLIDEPTNHLDLTGRQALSRYLSKKSGFILVSHDRSFLDACIDHVLAINRADITVTKGNFSQWLENKKLSDNFELAQNERLKKDIKRLEKTAKQKAEWSDKAEKSKIGFDPNSVEKSISRRPYEAAKAKKLMKRAKQIEQRSAQKLEEKGKLLKNIEREDSLKLYPLDFRKEVLAELRDVSVSFDGRKIFEGLSFDIRRGERIALVGKNGCGKSSVIKLIMQEKLDYTGEVNIASGLKISYVSQNTSTLCGSLTDYAEASRIDESLFKAILRKLDFSRGQFDKPMESFSEGQRKKVLIARSLCQSAHLYIWDEPLNYIDVISRMQLERLIKEFSPTMLFVEHDKAFCDSIATKKICF